MGFDKYLSECVQINPADIDSEFIRLSADLAYWSSVYADAYADWRTVELEFETLNATLSEQLRADLELIKGRVTVSQVEFAVLRDPKMTKMRRDLIEAEAEKIRIHGQVEAIKAKKEMLISLGANIRQERENDPMIRSRLYIEKETKG